MNVFSFAAVAMMMMMSKYTVMSCPRTSPLQVGLGQLHLHGGRGVEQNHQVSL